MLGLIICSFPGKQLRISGKSLAPGHLAREWQGIEL